MVLHIDLDNTLIYSYKHDIGAHKRNVEIYRGREISFVTEKTYTLLNAVKEKMLVVPTSTRSIEQYHRIDLGVGPFPYALVCNGGILLVDGKRDPRWYQDSLACIGESKQELERAYRLLETDVRRSFELRYIEELFLFTKCNEPEAVVRELAGMLDVSKVDVFHNGIKVYVVPKSLSKGNALRRFREYMKPDAVIAAGDSEFDVSMLAEADCGLAPYGFCNNFAPGMKFRESCEGELFSEYVLTECINIADAGIKEY